MISTTSNEKQQSGDIIMGGYNKQYSQPNKEELRELEKNVWDM